MTARDAAARLLGALRREESYSNILLENRLAEWELTPADKALSVRLVYGVLERQITLEWCLSACSQKPLKKLHPLVADTLLVAAYQIFYMERIPHSAAVNEAVKLIKKRQPYAAGFVNGVLHTLIRRQEELFQNLPAGDEGLSIRYSCPRPLIALWREAYGEERLVELLESLNEVPPTYVRVNTLRGDLPRFVADLTAAGVAHRVREELPACVEILAPAELKKQEKILQNRYYPQDMASQYACRALDARPGERVADVCAAPGGKTLTTAQYMQNRGEIVASDLYPAKCDVLTRRAAGMGATIVQTVCRDASLPPPREWTGTFDRVICDAPCSGLGVIRRKPEIRYKSLEELAALPPLQLTVLEEAAKLLKPGGVLQYSTCTLNPAENDGVARRFLETHPEFEPRPLPGVPDSVLGEPDWCRTLFPSVHQTDGFFIAGFQKKS